MDQSNKDIDEDIGQLKDNRQFEESEKEKKRRSRSS